MKKKHKRSIRSRTRPWLKNKRKKRRQQKKQQKKQRSKQQKKNQQKMKRRRKICEKRVNIFNLIVITLYEKYISFYI